MITTGLYVRLEAKTGKEKDVEAFLERALPLVEAEPATTAWFALRMGPATFGIFDVFPNEEGRQAHLTGKVAAALQAKGSELFAQQPIIEKLDILAAKIPQSAKAACSRPRHPASTGRPIRFARTPCTAPLTSLNRASFSQKIHCSPLTRAPKQQCVSQGRALNDLTRPVIVPRKLRTNREVCAALNQ